MCRLQLRTNRQSSTHAFYFLNLLFLLHICTAFLTIVNALNNNDNEAIIQLSVDSIHVVKSSDSRFANIEENANDNEEKELLIALLTSFDDDYKGSRQNYLEKTANLETNKELSLSKNCSSSTETVPTSSSSSIRFIPPVLDFGEQAIAIPRMQTVTIINDDSDVFELHSLSGTTVQFYSSFFTQKTLPANGGNTTINVYYLPRTLGSTKSTFTIKTNRGTLHYAVSGLGTVNPFHIRPLIGATIPLNSTFEYLVHFYNPYNHSIDINEIYTSDENLIIELLSHKNQKHKISKTFEHEEQWHIEPYRTKAIVKLYYLAHQLDRLHGFYCIKANGNETIVAPVEITVSDQENLYANVDILEFSTFGTIHSTARPTTVPVHVINHGRRPVTVTSIRVTAANLNYMTIRYEKAQVPFGVHHLTKIADLTIHPHLIPREINRIRGSVQIYTLTSSNTEELTLQIPFRTTIVHGSLDYEKESTYIYIPSSSLANEQTRNECQPIKLINRFQIPIAIYNLTTDKTDLLAQYIQMNFNSSYVMIPPEQTLSSLCVNILKSSTAPFANLEATLTLHTNLSFFHLPIYLYSGLLSINLLNDHSNGGIRRNDTNPLEYFLATIPVNEIRTVRFLLTNTNPLDISIEEIAFTLPRATLELVQMQTLNGSETIVAYRASYRKTALVQLVIPARHRAVFSLSVNGTSDPSFYHETITFKTRFETLNMNVKYRITSGAIELDNQQPLHIDVFPNRLGTVDVTVQNKFDEPIEVLRIEFATFGKCLSFLWNNTTPGKLIVDANQIYRIGKLSFDMIPLCNSVQTPSESTCYCGINNHLEFKQRWEQHVAELKNDQLDHFLVTKFRNLWKEWTTLVRKQRVHTNIWLVTDQANVSWPVSIGFVWPSVLEHMSTTLTRTPVILDFHLTLVDTTKTQNVIITNPSSTIVQYSIELTSTHENQRAKRQIGSANSMSTFDIAATSKRVEVSENLYRFHLFPNEHIIFTASYRPKQLIKQETYLVVRNNLTIIESILLRGEGGSGSLTVGNRKAGSSDIPLVLEMNEKQYKLCSNFPSADGTRGNPILQKIVTLRNTGNMKAVIHQISFGQSKCSGQGFSVSTCSDIEIESNDRYDLRIRFQPDYTLAEIEETLTLNTNIGVMTFPILVRIPQRVLATCYRNIPRPVWEPKVYWLCLCSIVILLLCILTYAVYEAYRLYNDYVARAELRSRMPIMIPSLVDLNDLTAAVQDEQKNRERIESRTSTSSTNNKREEAKPKDNELKAKRSNSSTNGNKDNGEIASKTPRSTDGSNTPVRSTATSPRATTNKQRRSTTDGGSTKASKHQHEPTAKLPVLRSQRSNNTEPSTTVTSRSPTPPSTVPSTAAATDDENEPFMVARPKRVSAKTKEPTTNAVPTKPTPTTESVATPPITVTPSVLPTPPPPPPPPPSIAVLPKPSSRSELSEQRQHQQDLSRSTDSINNQQWHMVSSNRGMRRGTGTATTRRETTDESSAMARPAKPTSTNSDNPVVSAPSSQPHAALSSSMAQSRRRRGRRPTRPLSPSRVSKSPTRQSLSSKEPIASRNRELAFRQLTEQLWAAGLPSSQTACSMSVRSRCSSAPPSERGGAESDRRTIDWDNDDEEENAIEWDAPGKPDEDFGRYVSQTEQSPNEANGVNEWSPPTPPASVINDTPTFLPVAATPSSGLPKIAIVSSTIKEDVEPLPFPQHGPGPIQRPNKLIYPPTQPVPSSYLPKTFQSPSTPEVLYQINRLLEQQSHPTAAASSASNANTSSVPIGDLSTPSIPWTTFAPTEWSSKYESSWPLTDIQSSPMPLTAPVQNPFAMMPPMSDQRQRLPPNEEATVWSTALGTATPRLVSSSTRTQRASAWNDIFQSTGPSSTELTKPATNSWLWSVPDPSSAGTGTANGHETNSNHSIWSLETLSNPSVIPSAAPNPQQVPSARWWSNSTSDENNNTSQGNHLNDDSATNRDHSRWDFAR